MVCTVSSSTFVADGRIMGVLMPLLFDGHQGNLPCMLQMISVHLVSGFTFEPQILDRETTMLFL